MTCCPFIIMGSLFLGQEYIEELEERKKRDDKKKKQKSEKKTSDKQKGN